MIAYDGSFLFSPLMSRPSSPYKEEKFLISSLKKKDMNAFTYLYDNYSPALFGIIDRIVRSEEIAADVLQEAFVKIWKNMESYSGDKGSLFTWMLNISRNLAIDTLRSKQYKNEIQNLNIDDLVYQVDKREQVEARVDHIGLKEEVNKLKPEQRILIEKVYFDGYTQDEVSKELDIPLGTVKTRLRAAMNELRSVIKV